jgi:hypothetical protein
MSKQRFQIKLQVSHLLSLAAAMFAAQEKATGNGKLDMAGIMAVMTMAQGGSRGVGGGGKIEEASFSIATLYPYPTPALTFISNLLFTIPQLQDVHFKTDFQRLCRTKRLSFLQAVLESELATNGGG